MSWKTCSTCACLTDLIYNVIRQRAIEWRVKESYRMANKNKPTITGNRCDQYAPLRMFYDNYIFGNTYLPFVFFWHSSNCLFVCKYNLQKLFKHMQASKEIVNNPQRIHTVEIPIQYLYLDAVYKITDSKNVTSRNQIKCMFIFDMNE